MKMIREHAREEKAIVLDFLPNGYPFDTRPMHMKTPLAQAIGKTHFVLLELVPKKDIFLQPNEEVYIGEGKRDKIHHILGRLSTDKLTRTAKIALDGILKDLIRANEQEFIEFFNKAGPINTRRHYIELLPGVGKKHALEILKARETEPFKSFEDIRARVKLLPDPEALIAKRIMVELSGEDKYKIFVK